MGTHCAKTPIWCFIWTLFRVADLWVQTILSNRTTAAHAVRGEKGGAEIEATLPNPSRLLRPFPSRALPQIQIPEDPQVAEQPDRQKIFSTSTLKAFKQ